MPRFRNSDEAVFGILLCLTGVIGIVLLMLTLYCLLTVGNFIGMPFYPAAITSLVLLIACAITVRWQLRHDNIAKWAIFMLLGACVWTVIIYFNLPVHDGIHAFLGIEGCVDSNSYSIAAFTPLGILILNPWFALIRWLASFVFVRTTCQSIRHWLTTYHTNS